MRQLRNALNRQEIADRSRRIVERLLGMEEVQSAASLFVYLSFRSEVETRSLIEILIADGKKVLVPSVGDSRPKNRWRATNSGCRLLVLW